MSVASPGGFAGGTVRESCRGSSALPHRHRIAYGTHMHDEAPADRVRIDRWLWAARFFKTRSLAAEAIDGGKVDVNGDRAKRSKLLALGDTVRMRIGQDEWTVIVRGLDERRGPAREARLLYEETEESQRERERLAEARRLGAPTFDFQEGKPSKKDRRSMRRLRGW